MRKLIVFVLIVLTCVALFFGYAIREPQALDSIAPPGSRMERALARLPFVDKVMCLGLPQSPQAFDTLDKDTLKSWIAPLRYVTNPQHLSIETGADGHTAFRQRFIPSKRGSYRVVVSVNVEPSRTYELEQSVKFEPGFQWGGEVESGKFGFGFAGGSAPTGGKVADDGFSARMIWRGNGDGTAAAGVYLYSVDRTLNLPFGDEFMIPDFTIPVDEWFRVKIRVTANSSHDASDGLMQVWINDELSLVREGIQWQSAGGQPLIDQVMYSSFHGGNTDQWSPQNEVYARFGDLCVYKNRQD